jgi:hypothetical protein
MDGVNLGGLQGKLIGKSPYHPHVNQQLPYGTLHLDDDSMSSMYLELMYLELCYFLVLFGAYV